MLGKCAGLLREILLAALFGTSNVVAAIRVAQSATLIPVNFFTADSLSAGFLPLYTRYRQDDQEKARLLFWGLSGFLFIASALVVALLTVNTGVWISWLVPGFGVEDKAYAVTFLRIMALGVPFYIAGGLFSYLEMGHGIFTLVSVRATLQSLGMIAGTLAAFLLHRPALLAWGFTLAYVFYAGWGLSRVVRNGWAPVPSSLRWADLRVIGMEFWRVVRPLVLLPLLLQGNIVIERAVASLCGVEASAALDYAKFITDTGVLLLAVPLGLAGLSTISQMDMIQTRDLLERMLPVLMLLTVPLSVALAAHGHLVISMVYERGRFGESSALLTRNIFWGFAIGFWAQVVSYVLIRALSAQLRNADVFKFMAISLAGNAAVNFGLYRWLGPAVLGLGGCLYGLVLLFLTAKAFGMGRIVGSRLLLLSIGSAVYGFVALLVPARGWGGVVAATLLFILFWPAYIASVPVLRGDVRPLLSRLRLRFA